MKRNQSLSITLPVVLAFVLAALSFASAQAQSGEIIVDSLADNTVRDEACTLREAIINANDDDDTHPDCKAGNGADLITFKVKGRIPLKGTLPTITEDLNITTDLEDLTIDGRSRFRVMEIEPAVSVGLSNLTIRGGYADYHGGGIFARSATLSIANCIISENVAEFVGAGIYSGEGGSLIIKDSIFDNNRADSSGGAIGVLEASMATITDSVFSNNTASYGGAIEIAYGGLVTVERSTFSDNDAVLGGAIFSNEADIRVTNSTFYGNQAEGDGGGILLLRNHSGPAVITNSTFSGNQAENAGGGIHIDQNTTLRLKSSTFSGNVAGTYGSGLYNEGTLRMMNTILANSPSGFDCYNTGSVTTNIHNLVERSPFNLAYWCGYPMLNADPMLGPLANNGGPTLTHALLPGSPAIDSGHNRRCASNYVWNSDQRGEGRPVDGDGDRVATCDIGSFEKE